MERIQMFDTGNFHKINEFNIITCSTIFLSGEWSSSLSNEVLGDSGFILNFDGRTIKAICLTKSSLNNFIEYLEN